MLIHIELQGEGSVKEVAAALIEMATDIQTLPIPSTGAKFKVKKVTGTVHKIIGTTSSRKASQKSKN